MSVRVVEGNLIDQHVEVLINAWNRNIVPPWLLVPSGVSRELKKRAGSQPFRELRRHGVLPLGGAVLTSAGHLPHDAIIHVAGINLAWRASEHSVRTSTENAIRLVRQYGYRTVAFPLLGAGAGSLDSHFSEAIMTDVLIKHADLDTTIVKFTPHNAFEVDE